MGHKHNYWYSQGAFRCKKCGHVTYKSEKGPKYKPVRSYKIPIIISVVVVSAILGYFVYQTYGMHQLIQNEANSVINNASNTIQQVSSQVRQQSTSLLQNHTLSFTNQDNRVPIAVFDKCSSVAEPDMKVIQSTCYTLPYGAEHNFKFAMPDSLANGLSAEHTYLVDVNSKVYQYGSNDFKIWLYDQTGGKNYTVSLWQLP